MALLLLLSPLALSTAPASTATTYVVGGSAYLIYVRSSTGTLQAVLTDYLWFTYSKRVNEVGLLQFALEANDDAIQYLTDKALVEVWHRDARLGVASHADYYGMVRTTQYSYPGEGPETFTVWAPSMAHILSWRQVAWTTGYASRSRWDGIAAETIAKTLVNYNACALATVANGRLREGAITGLTVEADAATGNTIDWSCAYANLLGTLQDIARVGGGDWDVVTTAPATWQWRWYAGQLGSDKSTTVRFALNLGNMANPVYTMSRSGEKTVALVAGQGENAARATAIRTGTNYNVTTNNIETFVDARNENATEGLNAQGDAALDEAEARGEFTFDVIETPACVYRRDFTLGDLVTARYRTIEQTVKIQGVSISMDSDGKETKSFSLAQP